MTKCSWKYVFGLFIGLLFMSAAGEAFATEGANAATEKKVETFVGATKLGDKKDQDVIDQVKQNCADAKKKVEDKEKEAHDIRQEMSKLMDTEMVTDTSPYDGSLRTYPKVTYKDEGKYKQLAESVRKLDEEIKKLKEAKDKACDEADEVLDVAEAAIYVYTGSDGSKLYFQYDGETAKSINGVTRGCIPLPMKLAEGRSCIFCPLFLKIFNAAQRMTSGSYAALSKAFANVLLVGFALWVAFSLLGKVSSFTKMDAPKYITELLTQAFKVLVAFLLLRDATAIYGYVLGPLLKAGMEFGMTLLSAGENSYLQACDTSSELSGLSSGLLPGYLYTQLECFIKAVQAELAVPQAIGSSLMCVARNAGAIDMGALTTVTSFKFPDLSMIFEGLIIWVFAWLLSLAFAFYLVDATVRLGIVGALMPFLIASWPFKVTSKYTTQGFTMFMNTFFTYVFMGLVVSINIQLMSESMSGVSGGMKAVVNALNSNEVTTLKNLLDIGFAGFLILIASCIFGFKLTSQATELAGSMAGGGGGSSIAPEIGGMGYNVAKAATLGTGKMAWQGTKLVGNATGVTPKLRQARDKVVSGVSSGLKSLFTFGRATSKSRAPVSRLRGSDAPAPAPSSSSSGGASPVTAEQLRQAERVENAAPRPTAPATPVTAANTAKPNQAGAEGTAPTSPEAVRERQIDQFNRKQAAGLDLANNSEIYKQVSERCGQATANRDAAAQRARNFEAQAKEEKDKATALRQKAQSMADGAEKDAVMRQAGSSDQKANEFTAQAAEERKNEKENDAIVQETLKKMDEMQKEREQSISDKEIDSIMKQKYGNNYRTEQSANINGWDFK